MMESLYDKFHRLFSYNAETGLLTRKVAILTPRGQHHNMPNCKAGDPVGWVTCSGYLQTGISRKNYLAHRIIWMMQTGGFPVKFIDHINGIRTDNRWINLREATHSENLCNRGKNSNNTTGFKGVCASKKSIINPYRAQIVTKGKAVYIGSFPTPELAHEAYCNKARELHGEFARGA